MTTEHAYNGLIDLKLFTFHTTKFISTKFLLKKIFLQ
jgi:hypothetical protein